MLPIETAIQRWQAVVGKTHVSTSPEERARAEKATFATSQKVRALLRPASREEVQECVRVANELKIPLYPISRGRNWGYGSKVPVRDDSVILDLGRMNRIVDFSETLAYVTVEPGVTQRQLFDYLREQKSSLCMSPTTGSPEGSLVGIALERGFGRTAAGDFSSQTCAFEVILASGECIHTGFSRFDGAKSARVDRWGVGPSLEGLFVQSSFGVVTQMTFWLKPAPAGVEVIYLKLEDDAQLIQAVNALRPLRISGRLENAQFSNEYRFLARIMDYPWERAGGKTPLGPELALELVRENGFGKWNVVLPLYGTDEEIRLTRDCVLRSLKGLVPVPVVIGKPAAGATDLLSRLYRLWSADLDGASALSRAYWRKRHKPADPAAFDLDTDGCGFLFMSVVAPFTGSDALAVNEIVRSLVLEHGFEPDVNFVALRERTVNFHCILAYDRDIAGEDARAMACYEKVMSSLARAGYHPHRLGVQSMKNLGHQEPAYAKLMKTLKKALDPNGILSPGRYEAE